MTKVIVTTDTDGNVTVCQPSPDARLVTTENGGVVPFFNGGPIRKLPPDDIPWAETEDEFVARIRAKDVPADAPNVTIVEDGDLPGRKFRNAWKQDAEGKPQVDMPKARDLHMDRIRVIRNEELQKEDINFQRAIEADDASAKTSVATKKQTLRNLPATFDLNRANTDDELDALWPSELPERG